MADKIPQLVNDKPETLATELLKEQKRNNKRMFILTVISWVITLLVIALFVWEHSLPEEEYVIDQAANENSYNQIVGGDFNGSEAASDIQTQIETG